MKIIRLLIVFMIACPLFVFAKNKDESHVYKMSAIPGQTIEQTLPTEKQFKSFGLDISPEIESWISVSRGSEISKSKHKGSSVHIFIQVPEDALLGTYSGLIYFDEKPSNPGKSLAIELAVLEPIIFLPPKPGNENDATVAGIDSDADGVRDDIQRYIYFEHAEQPSVQLALMDVARSLQSALIGAESPEEAYQSRKAFSKAYTCLSWLDDESAYEYISYIESIQMNTRARTRAYDLYHDSLVGTVIMRSETPDNYYRNCSFDVANYKEKDNEE